MISGMITGGILGRYEAAFSAMPLLVTFIPMLTDTGGNAGSQSSTLVIRGMGGGRDPPAGLCQGFLEGVAGEHAGGGRPQHGKLCPAHPHLPGPDRHRPDGGRRPVCHGAAGQDGGGRAPHGGQVLQGRPGHYGRPPSSPPLWTPSPWWSTSTSPALCCPLHEKIPVRIGGQGFFSFSSPCPGAHPRSP